MISPIEVDMLVSMLDSNIVEESTHEAEDPDEITSLSIVFAAEPLVSVSLLRSIRPVEMNGVKISPTAID